jgi:Sulfotransferase family
VYMSKLKEPQFFASEMHIGSRPSQLPNTLDEYLALFDSARPGQVAGEASPSYLRSHTAAGRIAEIRPDARIVAILREPASFLRSVHLQFVQAGMEDQHDLRRALELEADRREGKNLPRHGFWPLSLQYSDQVRYVEQLRRYHAVFAPEQVLVLIYDDFRADNAGTMRTVLRFLGVESPAEIAGIEANPTVGTRSPAAHRLLRSVMLGRGPVSRRTGAAIRMLLPRRQRQMLLTALRRNVLYGAPPVEDKELMSEMRRRFKPEVVALSEYLDRDLVGEWGYGELE